MKSIQYLFFILLILGMQSCKKDNTEDNEAKPVTVTVKFAYEGDNATLGLSLEKAQVKITNITTTQVYTAETNASGDAVFTNIAPGNYDVSGVQTIPAVEYNTKAGTNVTEAVVFNGTTTRQSFTQDSQLSIIFKTSRVGDLVIKQIYYAGSSAANGAIFRDQFVEIYNNSNETIYADSLYFGQVMNNAAVATKVDLTKGFYLAGGQYDWTKSIGMSDSKANTDYVYTSALFMVPGTGKQYPILPGASIVIAATALNHKNPYTGADGKSISVKDPTLTIDLSAADFEVYLGDQNGINPLASDVDNPGVTNLTVIDRGANRDLILDNLGRDGLIIFKSKADPKLWNKFPIPEVTQLTATTRTYIQVPVNVIIDGVGLQHATPASRIPKYMNDVIDAGETYVTSGSYSSQSVVRKASKTVNGRIVLKDTNNSANDFGVLAKSDPSKGASSFIN